RMLGMPRGGRTPPAGGLRACGGFCRAVAESDAPCADELRAACDASGRCIRSPAMATRYLVTAALPYSNGRLHVGHIAGAYLPADTYVRYRRARGDDVRFVCGSDDNAVAALVAARKEGTTVEELTARYNARQAADFAGLGIEFDVYGGTHQPGFVELHNRISQAFFRTIHDKGFFTKKRTR